MDCPHVGGMVKIASPPKLDGDPNTWKCEACNKDVYTSLCLCLTCGKLNCGRYDNGHAEEHFKRSSSEVTCAHCICMNVLDTSVHCYICNTFVNTDTHSHHVERLRKKLLKLQKTEEENSKENIGVCCKRKLDVTHNEPVKKSRSNQLCPLRRAGLKNLGNTCFMNSVLQCLNNLIFSKFIQSLPDIQVVKAMRMTRSKKSSDTNGDVLLTDKLKKVLSEMNVKGKRTTVHTQEFLSAVWRVVPRFCGYQQQDAHEFMRYLLDRIRGELQTYEVGKQNGNNGHRNVVDDVFGGLLQSKVKCLNCCSLSNKFDPMLDISVDIPFNDDDTCDLKDCLRHFTENELLSENDQYYCEKCKGKQPSTKKLSIRRLPNVLCIHLKRFRVNANQRLKIAKHVAFPIQELDMSELGLEEDTKATRSQQCGGTVYDLAGLIVHHGKSVSGGHYTAYVVEDDHWLHCNDSQVTCSDEETVKKCQAYVLFYSRTKIGSK